MLVRDRESESERETLRERDSDGVRGEASGVSHVWRLHVQQLEKAKERDRDSDGVSGEASALRVQQV